MIVILFFKKVLIVILMLFWFSDYCSKSEAYFGFLFIVSKVTLQHAPLF